MFILICELKKKCFQSYKYLNLGDSSLFFLQLITKFGLSHKF